MDSQQEPIESMPGRGPITAGSAGGGRAPAAALTADEFAERFRDAGRVLWTIAAGVLGDPADAEDVLQEACLMALEKLDRYQRGTNFTAWAGRFVRNVALNHARKVRRRATAATSHEVLGDLAGGAASVASEPTPDEVLAGAGGGRTLPITAQGELRAGQEAFDDELLAGLQSLSTMQRACLLMRAVLDLGYREISETLEIPEGTAMSHVHRARATLRAELASSREEALGMEQRA
jgi:RNA polymerase sigma-70 factor (ECF subfamily)